MRRQLPQLDRRGPRYEEGILGTDVQPDSTTADIAVVHDSKTDFDALTIVDLSIAVACRASRSAVIEVIGDTHRWPLRAHRPAFCPACLANHGAAAIRGFEGQ